RSDSFGMVLPEAWANGVPCVGYRAGGVGWVIRDGVDGLLAPCGDVAGLAGGLLRVGAGEGLRRPRGEAGGRRAGAAGGRAGGRGGGGKRGRVREVYRALVPRTGWPGASAPGGEDSGGRRPRLAGIRDLIRRSQP